MADGAALEEDLRNRVWEVRHEITETAVDAWDTIAHRRAQARLMLLAESDSLRRAERTLTRRGGGPWPCRQTPPRGRSHRPVLDCP